MSLKDVRVILASASPRRRELLGRIVENFEIITKEIDESLDEGIAPEEGVRLLAVKKGAAVLDESTSGALIISSDTLVELDGAPLGKPKDEADAVNMLKRMSGKTHYVRTGIAIHYKGRVFSETASSAVTFKDLNDGEISDYVSTGEPMDKAGAYGIQGLGGSLVAGYDGDFDTIMGLSLRLTEKLINLALESGI